MNFQLNNGTQFCNYRLSGGTLYYSQQGTGAWTVCGNGTFTNAVSMGNAILENTMIVGEGVGTTRHTTTGTSFTDTSGAPIAAYFVDYPNRIYAAGTASTLFWSVAGTPTNWSGTDSSSISIPGAGRLNGLIKATDRVNTTKNSGLIHRWDAYNLLDLSTSLGPTSPQSLGSVEGFRFYIS